MNDAASKGPAAAPPPLLFRGKGILILVVPFLVYVVAMSVGGMLDGVVAGDGEVRNWYPSSYTAALGLTVLTMLWVGRGYAHAPFSFSWLGPAVGVVGIFVWLGLWWVDQEFLGFGAVFVSSREGFDPFTALRGDPTWMKLFLAIRFLGLVLVVPIIEEFFVRGFLMRYVDSRHWDRLPLGKVTRLSAGAVVVYALASHPAEPLAAVAWFSMVTWLYARTGSIWDCVVAHATTNLLLGLYVVATGTWQLW
jgi:CAAX prenyl protease-like protein